MKRHMSLTLALCVVPALSAIGANVHAQEPQDLRIGAWDQSVQLERQGDLHHAKAIMLRAWGPASGSYEVTIRLAWLSLNLKQSSDAIQFYRTALTLEGAGPEAKQGLASALTMQGYERLEEGDRSGARETWQRALKWDPKQKDAKRGLELVGLEMTLNPEIWASSLNQSALAASWTGWAVLLRVPWQINDTFRIGGAFRHIDSYYTELVPSAGAFPPFGQESKTSRQEEAYFDVGFNTPYVGAGLMGLGIFSEDDSVPGIGSSLRVGKRYGVSVAHVSMRRNVGWNHQGIPQLYYWPSDYVGLSAGARITSDHQGEEVSVLGGASFLAGNLEFHLGGHFGTERWPFTMSTPEVLSIAPELTAGGTLTGMFHLSNSWSIGMATTLERIRTEVATLPEEETGTYSSASVGLRWSPPLEKGVRK